MTAPLHVRPAREEEWPVAFRFIFQATSESEREARIANGIRMVRKGELQPEGVWVAVESAQVKGAMVCLPVPGASALAWPPQGQRGDQARSIEDALLEGCCAWLRGKGVRIAQCLLPEEERSLAAPLLRHGFKRVTSLDYMRHDLLQLSPKTSGTLRFQSYGQSDTNEFRHTLERTYEGTLDCPELNGIRGMDEIIAGHLSQGRHDPDQWWLAFDGAEPVAVLLLTEIPEWRGWDLSYLGVVASRRGKGIGRQLTQKALWDARQAGQSKLTLSVDNRNRSAQRLYVNLGFKIYDSRDVYLALWSRPSEPVS